MPLVLAPFVALSLGALFAIALSSERSADEHRARRIGWLFALLSLTPNFAYFLCLSPDWSVGYLVHAGRLPSAVLLLFAAGTASLAPAAQHVSLGWIRGGQERRPLILAFTAAFAALVGAATSAHRLWLVGTYAEYQAGGTMGALGTNPRGLAIVVFDALTAAAVVACLTRPARARPSPSTTLR